LPDTKVFKDLQEFLFSQSADIPIVSFIIGVLVAAICAHLLGRLYVRCGQALSNRGRFARNFVPLALTTMLVISIVKSSLALSLGMVGALSIVRFRAAIKEPEEIIYLFLALAIGLGFGANQWRVTLVAFLIIAVLFLVRHRFQVEPTEQNLYLTVSAREPRKVSLGDLVKVLSENAAAAAVTRFDETADAVEATFLVEFDSFAQLNAARQALQGLNGSMTISFMDSRGVA
jgi:hypothetical protein